MEQTFEKIAQKVVNRFLQNILFIDDNAFQVEQRVNAFDAKEISSIFAKKGKLCTIIAPSSTQDLKNCSSLFAKTDVVVLDWYLNLENEENVQDEEADADDEEPRGIHTKKLIKDIIDDASDKRMKLIIIYTGDGAKLFDITNEVYDSISSVGCFIKEEENCSIHSSNITILVRAKSNGKGIDQLKYNEHLRSKIIDYNDLPDLIIKEFSNQVDGLLPLYVLSAISSIREQTSRILGVYSHETDYAFLGHRILLPNQNDAQHLLQKIFGESISDLTDSKTDMENWISSWVESRFEKPRTVQIGDKKIIVSKEIVKDLLFNSTDETYKDKIKRLFGGSLSAKEAISGSTCLFSPDEAIANRSNVQFAILTHHKYIFGRKAEHPILTLGTVVLYKNNYFVCIQQRCDSVRLKSERRFLFLPLTEMENDIHIQINKTLHLNVSINSFALKTIIFNPQDGEDCIFAKKTENENGDIVYSFESKYGEKLEWVLELKELHAQRIVDAYCSKLSRVGLDESEWLRLLK